MIDGRNAELPSRQGLRRQSQIHVVVSFGSPRSQPKFACDVPPSTGQTGRACERVHIHKHYGAQGFGSFAGGGPSRQNGARQVGDPGTVAFWAVGERPRAPLRPGAHLPRRREPPPGDPVRVEPA
ncbi:hypothetical protein SSAG_04550 [Streptomyces sp. Mg1]|nr:hypothetical protein SSAG_04550 [Streptomyces sp. Mg1]